MVKFLTKKHYHTCSFCERQRPRPYHQRLCEECEILGDAKRLKSLRAKYISRYFLTKPYMNKLKRLS